MAPNDILSSVIDNFLSNKEEHFLFLSLSSALMDKITEKSSQITETIDLKGNYTPLKPFLQILSEHKPSKKSISAHTYILQEPSLQSYFADGKATERKDILIWTEETYYEVKRFKQAIAGLMKKYVSENILILNAQEMGTEAVGVMEMLSETSGFKGKFIFCFDTVTLEESHGYINELIQKISMNSNYFEITNPDEDLESKYIASKDRLPDFETVYRCIKNCRIFLVLSQACALAKRIESSLKTRSFSIEQRRKLYMEMRLSYFYAGALDEAAFYLGNIVEYRDDDILEYRATFYLSQVLFAKNDNVTALKYANGTKKHLENNKNSEFYVYAEMMDYIITERTYPKASIEKYGKISARLRKLGLVNNFIHTVLTVPWLLIYNETSRKKIMSQIDEVEHLAKEIDNQFAVSTVCHWKGILLSLSGDSETALKWYKKCIDIRTEIGQIASVIKIRNGIAYEFLVRAEYKKSYDLINSFIGKLPDSSDYPEIVITLGNIAKALYYSGHFEEAYKFFLKILSLLYLFDLENNTFYHFIPEYNDILVYKTVIEACRESASSKTLTRAKITLNNLSNNGKPFSPIEETMKYFLKAVISLKEGNLKKSLKNFAETEKIFYKVGNTQEYRMVFMYFEFAAHLFKNGYAKEAEKYKNLGFELAVKKDFVYYTKNKKSATDFKIKDYINNKGNFAPPNINLEALEQKAEKVRLVNQLHKQLREAQFLNKVMGLSANTTNNIKYANSVVHVIFDYLMAEAVYIAEKPNEKNWSILASVSRSERAPLSNSEWDSFVLAAESSHDGRTYYDKKENFIFCNLLKFEFTGGIVIFLQKNAQLNSAEFDTMTIAFSNIQAQLVMLKQNEHLLIIASTDQLSMLKNRRALQDRLAVESETLRSYQNKHDMLIQHSITFIDLDNFKYYNDTYGHEAGDILITKFAQLLKAVYRKIDFIARFGGDEFVVIMPNTDCEEAKKTAERLHEALKAAGFFIHDLESLLGKKIDIPPENYLNFSCGICSNFDIEDPADMERTMINADHALYFSKHNKKGTTSIWSETKCNLAVGGKSYFVNKRQ